MTQLSPTALEAAAKAIYETWARNRSIDETWFEVCHVQHPIANEGRQEATAAITAYLAQREKEGFVEVPNSVFAWLFGEAPDADGRWFEPPEIKEGERNKPYWWRSKLRAMLAASQEQNDASN